MNPRRSEGKNRQAQSAPSQLRTLITPAGSFEGLQLWVFPGRDVCCISERSARFDWPSDCGCESGESVCPASSVAQFVRQGCCNGGQRSDASPASFTSVLRRATISTESPEFERLLRNVCNREVPRMNSGIKDKSPYFPQLTGIRFFAAAIVVFHHFWPFQSRLTENIGNIGVSFFFILSGFVITISNTDRNGKLNRSKSSYFISRLARIYPQYFLAFVINLPFVIYATCTEHHYFAEYTKRIVGNGLIYLSLLQAWAPPLANAWNGPGWSLSAEAFFYVCFAFMAIPTGRRSIFLCGFAAAAALIGIVYVGQIFPVLSSRFINFFPPLRLGEFVLGIVTAQVYRSGLLRTKFPQEYIALVLIGSVGMVAAKSGDLAVRTATTFAFPAAILFLAQSKGAVTRVLSTRGLVLLGEASYGLYIIQVPAVGLYMTLRGQSSYKAQFHTITEFFSYAVFAVGLSVFLYLYWERPAARALNSAWKS